MTQSLCPPVCSGAEAPLGAHNFSLVPQDLASPPLTPQVWGRGQGLLGSCLTVSAIKWLRKFPATPPEASDPLPSNPTLPPGRGRTWTLPSNPQHSPGILQDSSRDPCKVPRGTETT